MPDTGKSAPNRTKVKGTEPMLKALLWIILFIFVIGLLVVFGFFKLIF